MFEGLDDIGWAAFGKHIQVGRESTVIPQAILNLLSEDEEIRERGFQDLFGEGQCCGCHDTATPYLIPFLLEILQLQECTGKQLIYQGFGAIGTHFSYARTIPTMRLSLQIYDALKVGMPIYLQSLTDDASEVREWCVRFLRYMQDEGDTVIRILIDRYAQEPVAQVRATILESLAGTMEDMGIYAERFNPCVDLFTHVLSDGENIVDRVAAANAMMIFDAKTDRRYSDAVHQAIGAVVDAGQKLEHIKTDYNYIWLLDEYSKRSRHK